MKPITPDLTIAEILARWPVVIPVFLKHKMGCVGCHMNTFDTLADAMKIYNLEPVSFVEEINNIITIPKQSEI